MEAELRAALEDEKLKVQELLRQAGKGLLTKREYLEKQLDILTETAHRVYVVADHYLNKDPNT